MMDTYMDGEHTLIKTEEWTLIVAGVLFLASTLFIASGGNFSVHIAAKIFYTVGVVLFILRA